MQILKYLKADDALQMKLNALTDDSALSDELITDIDLDTSMNVCKDMPAIFTYDDNGSLEALLSVFAPGRDEIEVSALVRPESRKKGVFRNLLREAANTATDFGYKKGLFVCSRASAAGQAVMRRWGCGFDHAELQMSSEVSLKNESIDIEIVEARGEDIKALSILGAAAFDRDRESEEEIIRNSIASDNRNQYIAKYYGRMVGLCAAAESGGKMMIFGLGVHPEERRKGYARALLNRIAFKALKKGVKELCLDVDEDNPGAIALYESFGFKTTGCTEYYSFSLEDFR